MPMPDHGPNQAETAAVAEVMARVRRIELSARRLMQTLSAGEYRSAFRGRGLEFAEVRGYDESDDHRTIDWNVTARTGELHVRRYEEERELSTILLVDISGSQAAGTPPTATPIPSRSGRCSSCSCWDRASRSSRS